MKELPVVLTPGEGSVPLVVIVGETASGKSALAIDLATSMDGEIICADSRTVYKGMNIGTAKPSTEERQAIRHHCLDLVQPDEQFTAMDFKQAAAAAIDDVTARGKLPILVGGTGLYVDAILYDFEFRAPGDIKLRQKLNQLSIEELQQKLQEQGIPLPANARNPRHLIRALETGGEPAAKKPLRQNTLLLGRSLERDELAARISQRVEAMIEGGLEQEVKNLVTVFGWNAPGLQTIGYQEWQAYFEGSASKRETQDLIIRNTLQYAKRQRTWFKRNKSIQWMTNRGE